MKKYYCLLLIAYTITSCQETEIANSKDVNPEAIYQDYNISYDETFNDVDTRAQYRFGGSKGTTLVLNTPSKIMLDNKQLKVDSSKSAGAYYDAGFTAADFTGSHSYIFTDINNKTYKQQFSFKPLKLVTNIPATINSNNLLLKFDGLANGDVINVEIADTARKTENIDRLDTLRNNAITITAAQLKTLSAGPLTIKLSANVVKPLQQPTAEGGRLTIKHSLKTRQTILKH